MLINTLKFSVLEFKVYFLPRLYSATTGNKRTTPNIQNMHENGVNHNEPDDHDDPSNHDNSANHNGSANHSANNSLDLNYAKLSTLI